MLGMASFQQAKPVVLAMDPQPGRESSFLHRCSVLWMAESVGTSNEDSRTWAQLARTNIPEW